MFLESSDITDEEDRESNNSSVVPCCCGGCVIDPVTGLVTKVDDVSKSCHTCSVTGRKATAMCLVGGAEGFNSSAPCKSCVYNLCSCSLGYSNCNMKDKDVSKSPFGCRTCARKISVNCEPQLPKNKNIDCRRAIFIFLVGYHQYNTS